MTIENLILELNASGGVPSNIVLIPAPSADGTIKGRDGRWFRNDNPEGVIALWKKNDIELQGDYDHKSEDWKADTEACAWVKELYLKNGAVMATVEWTPEARQKIADRNYRYISPAFTITEEQRNIVELSSFALTNRPNLEIKALNSAEKPKHYNHEENVMTLTKELCQQFGLPETATDAEIMAKVKELNTAKIETNSQSADMVPAADYQLVLNRMEAAEKKLVDQSAKELNSKAEAVVDAAIEAKTVMPSSREYHLNNMKSQDDIDAFTKAFAGAEPIVGSSPEMNNAKAQTGMAGGQLSDVEKNICEQMGMSKEDFIKQRNTQEDV